MRAGDGGPGRFRELLYRAFLLGYPPSFRRRYRGELLETFRDAWRTEARGRPVRAAAFWLKLVRDGLANGLYTRLTRTRAPVGPFEAREPVGPAAVVAGLGRDVRYALRSFGRAPGFAALVVLTLGLGIGATTAVFSVAYDVLIRPLPYADAHRLVRLYMTDIEEPGSQEYVTGAHYLGWREGTGAFRALAAAYTYAETGADMAVGDRPERVRTLQVTSDYPAVLDVAPVMGRFFREDEERQGSRLAVLSEALWERRYGSDPAVLGEALVLGGEPYTVIGVLPAGVEDPVVGAVDVWLPQNMEVTESTNQPYNHYLTVVGRLAAGVPLERARAELEAVSLRLAERYPDMDEWRAALVPLHEDLVGGARPMLYVLLGAVGVVLLVVCVNVANLFLVRSLGRRRELGVRAALGSGALRIARQLLVESLALAFAGGALGLGVAWLGVEALVALGADQVPRLVGLRLDARLLGFAAVVTGLAGVAFGLAPALRFARPDVVDVLNERGRGGGRGLGRLRAGLVVTQVALSLVLLTGAGLLLASFQRLQRVELGFEPEGALTFQVHLPDARYDDEARIRFHDELTRRLGALPGVRAAGAINRLPATGRWYSWGTRPVTGPRAGQEDNYVGGNQRVVEGAAFDALGIEILEGRRFDTHDDTSAPRRVLINRYAADRLFPGVDAIGQQLRAGGRTAEVIGVTGDAVTSVEGRVRPLVFHHHAQFGGDRNWALTYVVRTNGDPLAFVPAARRELAALDTELVLFRPEPLDRVVAQGLARRSFALALMLAFAALTLGLAALGVYGVLAYAVSQRRHEIGVRMALGASAGRIRAMVLRRGLLLAGAGTLVGLAVALGATRWLRTLVFEVSVTDPRVLAAVSATVLGTAVLSALVPAIRATHVEPRAVLEE